MSANMILNQRMWTTWKYIPLPGSLNIPGDPAKKYPTNKESADHSACFMTAVSIVDRSLGIAQFTPEKYNDPVIKDLIGRITISPDATLIGMIAAGFQ
ncbi:MAG: hypothetical protein ACLRZZ_01695 [Enterocloster sp.]